MELTQVYQLSGESIWINKDKVVTIETERLTLDIAEGPRSVTVITLDDDRRIYTDEGEYDMAWRLNQSEIEAAVDKLLAHDADGKVVTPG